MAQLPQVLSASPQAVDARASAVARILDGAGAPEDWTTLDARVHTGGLRRTLGEIGEVYVSRGARFTTAEERWWISNLG